MLCLIFADYYSVMRLALELLYFTKALEMYVFEVSIAELVTASCMITFLGPKQLEFLEI